MQLPNAGRAVIDTRKISAYLLSVTHPVGRHKWRYFQALGFSPDDVGRLTEALRTVAQTGRVVEQKRTPFGIRYIVDGSFDAPNGARASLRTVWIVDGGTSHPRFVTAFPHRPGREGS